MKRITISSLRKMGACESQVELLEEMFGKSIPVTKESVDKCYAIVNIDWFAQNFLTGLKKDAYDTWDAYLAAVKPLQDAYYTARKPLWYAYEKACGYKLVELLT